MKHGIEMVKTASYIFSEVNILNKYMFGDHEGPRFKFMVNDDFIEFHFSKLPKLVLTESES